MYNNTDKRNKPSLKTNIFDIAEQIKDQQQAKNQARDIINAYRKVQNIKAPHTSNNQSKKIETNKQPQKKPTSQYANKVKETLKELNANRKKEIELNKEIFKSIINGKNNFGPAERHLINSGLKLLTKILERKYNENIKNAFQFLMRVGNIFEKESEEKIQYWKMRRAFSAWQYEVMLTKIEREKKEKAVAEKEKHQMLFAADFNYFITIKKVLKNWKLETKRALKKRQLQFEQNIRRQEQLERIQKQKQMITEKSKKREPTQNIQLQNKMKGFLEGLKQQVENKDRLKTIKQKTEESHLNQDARNAQQVINSQNIENAENNNEVQENNIQNQQNVENNVQNNQPNEAEPKVPLTNQDLEKRRKQLQKKAKQRKQALDKLKREKEEKKKQEQEERLRIQKEIEEEQKRIRQEQYKKFMKQKKEEEEWLIKQKQLTRQAIQFDALRLKKFYGWIQWIKLEECNQERSQILGNILNKILMKRKLEKFVEGVVGIGNQRLGQIEQKMNRYYRRKLAKKCIARLKLNKDDQLRQKQQYEVRHEVYTLKIFFKQWIYARQSIQLQNYQWERPRMKRAQCLHIMTLLHKSFESFKINRDQQIQNKKIQEHKAKIKQKVHSIVQEKPTINYDDFL